jgi:hypothetical protein
MGVCSKFMLAIGMNDSIHRLDGSSYLNSTFIEISYVQNKRILDKWEPYLGLALLRREGPEVMVAPIDGDSRFKRGPKVLLQGWGCRRHFKEIESVGDNATVVMATLLEELKRRTWLH